MVPAFPALVLSLVIATLYATLFHLLWGRTLNGLIAYWLAALAGFAVGQLAASALSLKDVQIGELHLLAASTVCWLSMAFARRFKL
jgi:hypothetical protein